MSILRSFIALFKGFQLCLFESRIRRLAVRPWLIGAGVYIASCAAAYYAHDPLLQRIAGEPQGFLAHMLYYLARILLPLFLIILSMVATMMTVMIFASVFQTAIAVNVLQHLGASLPQDKSGLSGIVSETSRTVFTELVKALWLYPCILLSLVLGLIPFFAPVSLLLAAWLLAYNFIDIVLDVFRAGAAGRLWFSLRHGVVVICFGLSLTILWAIPLLGLFLPPVAVAGAAWLLHETGLLKRYSDEETRKWNTKNGS